MKRLSIAALLAATLFTSCNKIDSVTVQPSVDFSQMEKAMKQNTQVQASLQNVSRLVNDIMDKAKVNGRAADGGNVPTCANIQTDTKNKSITVDFGNGCSGAYGTVKGVISISYSGAFGQTGTTITVKMTNLTMGDVSMNGTISLSDFKLNPANTLEYKINVNSLNVVTPTGSVTTSVAMAQTWKNFLSPSTSDDELLTSLNGSFKAGDLDYAVETTTSMLTKGSCETNVPVSGVVKLSAAGVSGVLDYGSGTCDTVGILTVGGQSKSIELK